MSTLETIYDNIFNALNGDLKAYITAFNTKITDSIVLNQDIKVYSYPRLTTVDEDTWIGVGIKTPPIDSESAVSFKETPTFDIKVFIKNRDDDNINLKLSLRYNDLLKDFFKNNIIKGNRAGDIKMAGYSDNTYIFTGSTFNNYITCGIILKATYCI